MKSRSEIDTDLIKQNREPSLRRRPFFTWTTIVCIALLSFWFFQMFLSGLFGIGSLRNFKPDAVGVVLDMILVYSSVASAPVLPLAIIGMFVRNETNSLFGKRVFILGLIAMAILLACLATALFLTYSNPGGRVIYNYYY